MARQATHETCEDHLRLDVRSLARHGLLNGTGTVEWSRGDHVTRRVAIHGDGQSIKLTYVIDDQEVVERVDLSSTPVHFGGYRSWFICPGCAHRVVILYGKKRFRCRHCKGLRYRSQRESAKFRAISRVQRIRVKLGASADLMKPRPCRPRYMHARTFERLIRQENEAWQAFASIEAHRGTTD